MEELGLGDISKMKVAELKKQLKAKGLSITGNKNELVERLQEAFTADGLTTGADSSADIDEEEFDEEEILGDEGEAGEEGDISKITPQEEAAVLGSDTSGIQIKDVPASVVTEQQETKKISLKRSVPCLSTPTTEVSATTEETKSEINSIEDKENSTIKSPEPKHKVIKLSESEIITPEDRAKKFGTETTTTTDAKSARASRFKNEANAKPNKLSMETGGTDMTKLKKRAERFGEVTSKSLTKLEITDKMKQRESRFGKITTEISKSVNGKSSTEKTSTTSTILDEKAAARAIKFGTTKTNGDDAKLKRAERFAAK